MPILCRNTSRGALGAHFARRFHAARRCSLRRGWRRRSRALRYRLHRCRALAKASARPVQESHGVLRDVRRQVGIALGDDDRRELQAIGRPSIIVATFDLDAWIRADRLVDLLKLCCDIRRNERNASAELQWCEPVWPASIEDIWRPGDPDYDAFGNLPNQ
ncbi:MAG TPA: hypothetical protein VIX73_06110 [Kofleriaceae bacterium]